MVALRASLRRFDRIRTLELLLALQVRGNARVECDDVGRASRYPGLSIH